MMAETYSVHMDECFFFFFYYLRDTKEYTSTVLKTCDYV